MPKGTASWAADKMFLERGTTMGTTKEITSRVIRVPLSDETISCFPRLTRDAEALVMMDSVLANDRDGRLHLKVYSAAWLGDLSTVGTDRSGLVQVFTESGGPWLRLQRELRVTVNNFIHQICNCHNAKTPGHGFVDVVSQGTVQICFADLPSYAMLYLRSRTLSMQNLPASWIEQKLEEYSYRIAMTTRDIDFPLAMWHPEDWGLTLPNQTTGSDNPAWDFVRFQGRLQVERHRSTTERRREHPTDRYVNDDDEDFDNE